MKPGFCRKIVLGFAVFYMLALAVLLAGLFGLFGQEKDPLSGIFLIPVGLPWIWMVDKFPEELWPWLTATAPALNLVLLWFFCRALGSRNR